jgi:hypothetical protein
LTGLSRSCSSRPTCARLICSFFFPVCAQKKFGGYGGPGGGGGGYPHGGKRRVNSRTGQAQRDEVIRRTVYVSDIDHQVSTTDPSSTPALICTFLLSRFRLPASSVLRPFLVDSDTSNHSTSAKSLFTSRFVSMSFRQVDIVIAQLDFGPCDFYAWHARAVRLG